MVSTPNEADSSGGRHFFEAIRTTLEVKARRASLRPAGLAPDTTLTPVDAWNRQSTPVTRLEAPPRGPTPDQDATAARVTSTRPTTIGKTHVRWHARRRILADYTRASADVCSSWAAGPAHTCHWRAWRAGCWHRPLGGDARSREATTAPWPSRGCGPGRHSAAALRDRSFDVVIAPYGVLQSPPATGALASPSRGRPRSVKPGGRSPSTSFPTATWREYTRRVALKDGWGRKDPASPCRVGPPGHRRRSRSSTTVHRGPGPIARHDVPAPFRPSPPRPRRRLDAPDWPRRRAGRLPGRPFSPTHTWISSATPPTRT